VIGLAKKGNAMRRILATSLTALLLVLSGAPLPATAAPDAKGPPCADITSGLSQSGYRLTSDGGGLLYLEIRTVKPLCSTATLTVNLNDSDGGSLTFTYPTDSSYFGTCEPDPVTGVPVNCISFTYRYPVAPQSVDVYLETHSGTRLIDRAPGSSSFTFCLGGCPPSGSWDQ
jgi:hypothetical protein